MQPTTETQNRITPNNITELAPNEVFVFGSNEAGTHGAGAAKQARKWGAKWGSGFGLHGQTFGIPTKNARIKTISIPAIAIYVETFIERAKTMYADKTFLVTEIGCGLAGYTPEEIAPLFKEAVHVENIHLPERFWNVLNKE